jgi:two-component system response regulator FlrC
MQPLSGIDLLALARARQPDCPVILITAFGSPEVRAEAYRLGAAAFLEKPLEATKFVRQVHRLVTGARPPDSAGGEIR